MFTLIKGMAVVTGAAQGNGAAIARGLAEAGAPVALCDVKANGAKLREVAQSLPGPSFHAAVDVREPEAVARFAHQAQEALGTASVLVNNAGVIHRATTEEPGYGEQWAHTMGVNLDGPRHMITAFLPQLTQTNGAIINLGSIMSVRAGPGLTAYAASKGALAQYTKALAHDLAPKGVRVNALLPGVIATPMTAPTRNNPEAIGRFMAHTPMGRTGQPEELVGPVIFLASSASSYITGALLPVDGGYLAA